MLFSLYNFIHYDLSNSYASLIGRNLKFGIHMVCHAAVKEHNSRHLEQTDTKRGEKSVNYIGYFFTLLSWRK